MDTQIIHEIRVGEPMRCGGVALFPLYVARSPSPDGIGTLDYALSAEAMNAGTVEVREICEEGLVGELLVDNGGDQPVLFLEGEGLKGAKQNRILRSSVLVAGRSRTKIPVVCVEKRRWRYESRKFSPGSCCPPTLRHLLKGGSPGAGYGQTQMWAEIQNRHHRLGVQSRSQNLSDALDTHRDRAEGVRRCLSCPEGASGIAVAINGKIISIDLFDKPMTLAKIWDRMVQGVVLDALETVADDGRLATDMDVSARLYALRHMTWRRAGPTAGLGEAYRASSEDGTLATALVVDGNLLHLGVSTGPGQET
ncbi:MAG: ARPP-1 family domain-containing protein [Thermoguttaceae bacterium]